MEEKNICNCCLIDWEDVLIMTTAKNKAMKYHGYCYYTAALFMSFQNVPNFLRVHSHGRTEESYGPVHESHFV